MKSKRTTIIILTTMRTPKKSPAPNQNARRVKAGIREEQMMARTAKANEEAEDVVTRKKRRTRCGGRKRKTVMLSKMISKKIHNRKTR